MCKYPRDRKRIGPMAGKEYAAYLNARAKRVSPEVVNRIEELLPPDDIFYCTSLDDARAHARTLVERGYQVVFTGGGDGTVCRLVNALFEAAAGPKRVPTLAVLPLGTGNALSRLVSSGNALSDLKAYVSNPSLDIERISLISASDVLFPFGGVGLDGEVVADHGALLEHARGTVAEGLLQSIPGYVATFALFSLPRHLKALLSGERTSLKVVNLGELAVELGPYGRRCRNFSRSEVLYEGTAVSAMFGTVPIIGYGARILPWADSNPSTFQLRIVKMGVLHAAYSLPQLLKGGGAQEGILDFHVQRVRVEISPPAPFQAAGERMGYVTNLELEVIPAALKLLRFI